MKTNFILLIFALFQITYLNAQTSFTASSSGNFGDGATWGNTSPGVRGVDYPGSGDTAIIPAATIITVAQNDTCSVISQLFDGSFTSSFIINSGDTLIIENTWTMLTTEDFANVDVQVNGLVNVGGRYSTTVINSSCFGGITIGSSGELNLNSVAANQILLNGTDNLFTIQQDGILNVSANLLIRPQNGSDVTFNVNSKTTFNSSLILAQSGSGSTINVNVDDTLHLKDLTMSIVGGGIGSDITLDLTTAGATVFLSGNFNAPSGGTIASNLSNSSSFIYNGSSLQTIQLSSSIVYHNLVIDNPVGARITKILKKARILNNLIIKDGAQFRSNGFNARVGANLTFEGTGSFVPNTNDTLKLNGTAQQIIAGDHNFTGVVLVSNTSANGIDLDPTSNLTFSKLILDANGNFESNGANFQITGDLIDNGIFTMDSGDTLTFNGGTTQTVTGRTIFDAVKINNNSTLNLLSGTDSIVFQDIIIESSSVLDNDDKNFSVRGNWVNNAGPNGFTPEQNSRVRFNGTNTQSIEGADSTYFENIVINNSSASFPSVNLNQVAVLRGLLDVNDGQLNANGNLILNINSATSSGVLGNLGDFTPETPSIVGNIQYKRSLEENDSAHWYLVASPLINQALSGWTDDTYSTGFPGSDDPGYLFVSMSTWDESTCSFTTPTAATDNLNNGSDESGWFVYANTGEVLDLEGEIKEGTVSISGLTSSATGCPDGDGWHLIGNPYASHVFWDNVTMTNIAGASGGSGYVLKEDASGDYVEYDHNTASDILSAGEGIWVQVAPGLLGTVEFNEDDKTLSTQDNFNSVRLTSDVEEALLNIHMLADGTREDNAIVALRRGVSVGYEWFNETQKIANDNNFLNIATEADSIKCLFNSIPDEVDSIRIPIKFYRKFSSAGSTHTYELTFNNVEEFLSYNKVLVLEDSVMNTFTELTTNGQQVTLIGDDNGERRFFLNVYSPLEFSSINPTCFNTLDGSAIVEGSGNGPFDYTWMDSNNNIIRNVTGVQGADTINGIGQGIYNVIVSGNSDFGTVTSLVELVSPLSPDDIEIDVVAPTCFNGNDGAASITFPDTVNTNTWEWSFGGNDSLAQNLSSGNYTVSINNPNGCMATKQVIVPNGPEIIISSTTTGVNCYGDETGAISIATPTSSYYSIEWSNGSTQEFVSSLTVGTYTVTVTDLIDGCEQIESYEIIEPDSISTNATVTNVSCNDAQDGSIVVDITGGTPPYELEWNFATQSNSNQLDSLSGGVYIVEIEDAQECITSMAVQVNEPQEVNAFFEILSDTVLVNENVLFDNSSIGASTYAWEFGDGNSSTLPNPTNAYASAGDYEVILISSIDGNCADTAYGNVNVQLLTSINPNFDNTNPIQIIQNTNNQILLNTYFDRPSFIKIETYNSAGQLVTPTISSTVLNISLELETPQTKGMYSVIVFDNNEKILTTKKIIIN